MTRLRRLLTKAIGTATPSMEALAERLQLSSSALRRYRLGDRTPSPAVGRALARELRRQARVLERLAHQLEEASTEEEDHA